MAHVNLHALHEVVCHWKAALCFVVVFLIQDHLRMTFGKKLSALLLQRATVETLKESLVEAWTNIGLVSALMLTIACPMVLTELPTLKEDYHTDYPIKYARWGTFVYVFSTLAAVIMYMQSILKATSHIMAVKPLNKSDLCKFALKNLQGVGAPYIDMCAGILATFVSLSIWMGIQYGETGVALAVCATFWIMKKMRRVTYTDLFTINYEEDLLPEKDGDYGDWKWILKEEDKWPNLIRSDAAIRSFVNMTKAQIRRTNDQDSEYNPLKAK